MYLLSGTSALSGRWQSVKKVRLVGVIGLAPAAVGLAIPAANAATAGPQVPKNAGKTVSLDHRMTPLITCGFNKTKIAASVRHNVKFTAAIAYSGKSCVSHQSAIIHGDFQTGRQERVRFYSGGGARIRQVFIGGGEYGASTQFVSAPRTYAHEVCQAVVAKSNHNNVEWGPLCETTG